MNYGFVYETTNLYDGKKYIGKHKRYQNISDPDDSTYFGSGKRIREIISKYGVSMFRRRILCECYSEQDLIEKERYYIQLYDAVNSPLYYNMVEDANPPLAPNKGKKAINKDGKCIMVDKDSLQSYLSEGWVLGGLDRGKRPPASMETRRKISEAGKGRKLSEEAREKLRKFHEGTRHTMESRKKMSETKTGKRKWIHNDINGETLFIEVVHLEDYLSSGWRLGRH